MTDRTAEAIAYKCAPFGTASDKVREDIAAAINAERQQREALEARVRSLEAQLAEATQESRHAR